MKKTHLIALLAFTVSISAQQKSTKQSYSYNLNEAIEYALAHNYSAINAGRDIDAAKAKKWETTTIGLPQINAAVGYQNNIKLQKLRNKLAFPTTHIDIQYHSGNLPAIFTTLTNITFDFLFITILTLF